jgi:hypothetical protein
MIGKDKFQFHSSGADRIGRFSTNYRSNLKEKSTIPQSHRAECEAFFIHDGSDGDRQTITAGISTFVGSKEK